MRCSLRELELGLGFASFGEDGASPSFSSTSTKSVSSSESPDELPSQQGVRDGIVCSVGDLSLAVGGERGSCLLGER